MQRIMFAWTEWHYGNDTNASRLKKTIAKKKYFALEVTM